MAQADMRADGKMQKPTGTWTKNEAMLALDDIRQKYPKMVSTDIERFAQIYYPIAIIEMTLEEETFESLDPILEAVLGLVQRGITDDKAIADSLGLTPGYIFRVIRLLNGYGHMNDNQITELGKASISAGKKIIRATVVERFQIDALNGTLLRMEQLVDDRMLTDKDKTRFNIAHLNYLDGVDAEPIMQQVRHNTKAFIKQKGSILNTNVLDIKDVNFVELKFAKSYLIKFRNNDKPVIFARRFDENAEEFKLRYGYEPFGIPNKVLAEKYGFLGEGQPNYNTELATEYIDELYNILLKRGAYKGSTMEIEQQIMEVLYRVYPFADKGVKIGRTDVPICSIMLKESAFEEYRPWLVNFLIGLSKDGEYLITHEDLYGGIYSLQTETPVLLDTADLMAKMAEKYGKMELIRRFRSKFFEYNGSENIILAIQKDLNSMK